MLKRYEPEGEDPWSETKMDVNPCGGFYSKEEVDQLLKEIWHRLPLGSWAMTADNRDVIVGMMKEAIGDEKV